MSTPYKDQAHARKAAVIHEEQHPVIDLSQLREGESVLVQDPGRVAYAGVVDESMPQFSLVWIRETRTGERRLVLLGESYIYRSP